MHSGGLVEERQGTKESACVEERPSWRQQEGAEELGNVCNGCSYVRNASM
jgi:hypothetical protein